MMLELLKFLGAFALGSAAVAWLIRALVTQVLSKDLDRFRSDLKIEVAKRVGVHQDKLVIYRAVTDTVVELLADLNAAYQGERDSAEVKAFAATFDLRRMKLYGYLGMVAPQEVMNSHDAVMDHLLAVVHGEQAYDWEPIRELVLDHLNAIRVDLAIDKSPIAYHGSR